MLYHVIVTLKNDHRTYVKLDLSEDDLEAKIIKPYYSDTLMTVQGKEIRPNEIETIEVRSTNIRSEDIVKELNKKYTVSLISAGYQNPLNFQIAKYGKNVTKEFIHDEPIKGGSKMKQSEEVDNKKVFVVHGRNLSVRDSIFQFLRSINLNPIEWDQARALTQKANPYIGEILDAAYSYAQAILVLLTPEDHACLDKAFINDDDQEYEKKLTPQPRPNVIFEAGMAIGRDANRTVIVQLGIIRPISDIAGKHILKLDNSTQKRQELAIRLQDSGCNVNLSGTDWHTIGNFIVPNLGAINEIKNDEIEIILAEDEERLLNLISKQGEFGITKAVLLRQLGIGYQKGSFYLEKLQNIDFIRQSITSLYDDFTYHLTLKSRNYLIQHNLLEDV